MDNDSSSSLLPENCMEIEKALFGSNYAVIHLHLVLLGSVLIAICSLAHKYNKNRIAIHRNLKLLLVNTIILYVINSFVWFVFFLRYRILLFTYKNACDFLSPVWMVPVFSGPQKLYSIAYPFFHFAIAFERFCSTFFARKYERMGTQLIIKIIGIIWLLSSAYMIFIICTALADPRISGQAQGIVTITTATNADAIFYCTIISMVLVVLTALSDWCIFLMNKRIVKVTRVNRSEYDLSLNYQINENTKAMLVIFPVDISYAIIYPIYNILVLIIRVYRSTLSTADFVSYCYLANTPLFLHSLITVFVYIRFVSRFSSKMKQRNFVKKSQNETTNVHFKLLEEQWNC